MLEVMCSVLISSSLSLSSPCTNAELFSIFPSWKGVKRDLWTGTGYGVRGMGV